jgi:hypothetical protein
MIEDVLEHPRRAGKSKNKQREEVKKMKKVAIIAVLCTLLMVTLVPGVILAKAEKLDLRANPPYKDVPGPDEPVAGFAILNNDNEANEVVVVVSLKEGAPNTFYKYVCLEYYSISGVWQKYQWVGSLTTNRKGKGNFDTRVSLDPGTYYIQVALSPTGAWGLNAFGSDIATIIIK